MYRPDANAVLTSDFDKTRPYHYPYYDWSNLFESVTKEDEVVRLSVAIDAVK